MSKAIRTPLTMSEPENDPSCTRILVVEDNKDTAMSLMTLLAMKGYMVHTAYDGLMAVEVAGSFDPDVVLLDIGLPGISGHEVARRIRANSGGKNVRMIALTAWGDEENRRLSKEVGCEHHLVKPVLLRDLMRVLG